MAASSFFTVRLSGDAVELIDQRRLPAEECYLRLESAEAVARAIEDMAVRGAPAIGVTAAMAVALELGRARDGELAAVLERASARLARTRPTAVNLAWALARMSGELGPRIAAGATANDIRAEARALAQRIHDEDVASCRAIGDAGAALLGPGSRVLTHCNAGALATAGYGTALGVIRSAARLGRVANVLAQETRPFLQGARLTAWELARDGIPVVLVTDGMGGALMARGEVDAVVVGADRIAANGDVANKIGTYTLAVLARAHGLPFYVAAPLSTVDLATPTGAQIPIEERSSDEVTRFAGQRIAPEGVRALHPAFDVTPHTLVTAIVTEKGALHPPFGPALAAQRRASEGR
ncbi:MAG: S-methyl-5-thioribose-1-phosphate isomerase [Solirubrobacteraceae bacterium]